MKLYYIDQSFFLESTKAKDMLMRLIQRLRDNEPDIILISASDIAKLHNDYQSFLIYLQDVDIHVIEDKEIRFGHIHGILAESHCVINDHLIEAVPYSYVQIDTDGQTIACSRYYLDIFYQERQNVINRVFTVKELESFLKETIGLKNIKKLS